MGVNGLWKLLEPVGRPVSLEALENKTLAVDISVWLNQALYGMRNQHGSTIPNAHLVLLFQRICKLLFYRIKPIFVFDGGVPELKKKSMAARREFRLCAHRKASAISHKVLRKYLKSHVIGSVTGKASKNSTDTIIEPGRDLFELSPLPEEKEMESASEDESFSRVHRLQEMEGVDIDSEDFRKLPPEIQHEIIVEMHEKSKRHSRYMQNIDMPEASSDFSNFQLKHLLTRGKLTQRLGTIRKEMNEQRAGELALNVGGSEITGSSIIQSQKIMSEDSAHYILIKRSEVNKKEDANTEEDTAGGFFREDFPKEQDLKQLVLQTFPRVSKAVVQPSTSCALDETISSSDDEICVDHHLQGVLDIPVSLPTKLEKSDVPENIEKNTSDFYDRPDKSGKNLDNIQKITTEKHLPQEEEYSDERKFYDNTMETEKNDIISSNSEYSATQTTGKCSNEYEINSTDSTEGKSQDLGANHSYISDSETSNKTTEDQEIDDFEDEIKKRKLLIEKLLANRKRPNASENQVAGKKEQLDIDGDFLEGISRTNVKIDETELSVHSKEKEKDTIFIVESDASSSNAMMDSDQTINAEPFDQTVNEFQGMSHEDLEEMQERLNEDLDNLKEERSRQTRLAATVSDEMYKDSQELLQLFGIPYVMSPMEAEAQCATLNTKGLCEGSITEDSDIVLFGGKKVYKNVFNQNRNAEIYQDGDIKSVLGLDRQTLITIALLTGSDYTEGVQGIGVVSAMEIIQEFSGNGIDKLINLKKWLNETKEPGNLFQQSKLKNKLVKKNITFPVGFPSPQVFDAYLNPAVDDSNDTFSWGKPDLHGLRLYASEKLGWSKTKTDEILLPVLKNLNNQETQSKITSFFPVQFNEPRKIKSQRVKRVVNRLLSKELDKGDDIEKSKAKTGTRKRKIRKNNSPENENNHVAEQTDLFVKNVESSFQQNTDSTDSTSDTSEEETCVLLKKSNTSTQPRGRGGRGGTRGLRRTVRKRQARKNS